MENISPKPIPKKGIKRVWAALFYSGQGLRHALANEAAFRQECILCLLLFCLLPVLSIPISFKILLFAINMLVLITELLNSAIEAVVDLASPDYHLLAKQAKDLASAAVFVSLLAAFVMWFIAIMQTIDF